MPPNCNRKQVAIGFDEGTVVLKLGHEMPVASLDTHTGKVVWALNSEIQTASLKGLVGDGSDVKDGERLAIVPKVWKRRGGAPRIVCSGEGGGGIHLPTRRLFRDFALSFAV